MKKKFCFKDGNAPTEFPVERVAMRQAIPRDPNPSWVDEAELVKLENDPRPRLRKAEKSYERSYCGPGESCLKKLPGNLTRMVFDNGANDTPRAACACQIWVIQPRTLPVKSVLMAPDCCKTKPI